MRHLPLLLAAAVLLPACAASSAGDGGTIPAGPAGRAGAAGPAAVSPGAAAVPVAPNPREPRLRELRRITHGGENAEAYWSPDGERLIFQATRPGGPACDQIFTIRTDGTDEKMVSTGEGRTTCGYFLGAERIVYSSTHLASPACPPPPDRSRGYVWPLDDHDVFTANRDGSGLRRLTETPGYDAEATVSPDGRSIVFTSVRDGDLEIYRMDADGGNVRRLTHTPGYDGGPFFSPDGSRIVYRAHRPETPEALADYRALLAEGLIRPGRLEIWVMDADGSNQRRVTDNGAANFAPFWHPDGERIIFSSNMHDPTGRDFELYLVRADGTGLERVTHSPEFDGFPMFSPDGRRLAFASNRAGSRPGETNVFVAEWVEDVDASAAPASPDRSAAP